MGAVGLHVLGEAAEHADRVLEPVPARDLGDQRRVLGDRRVLDQVREARDAGLAAVEAAEQSGAHVIGVL